MRAGKLRKYITIEQRGTGQDAAGSQVSTWTTVLSAYASIEPLSGRELIAAQAIHNETTHRVTMRYRSEVLAKMRVNLGGRYFNILTPPRNTEERGREMVFEASEGLTNG